MDKEIVKRIINIWDPLGVFGLAPKDEYDYIVMDIVAFFDAKTIDEGKIKKYLLNQYYSEAARNEEIVNELFNVFYALR